MYSRWKVAVVAILMLSLGVAAGKATVNPEPANPAPPARVVEKTKEVTKEVQIPTMPASCARTIELSRQMYEVIGKMEAGLGKESEIMAAAYSAMLSRSTTDLNGAVTKQRSLKSETAQLIQDLVAIKGLFDKANDQCSADSG